MMTFQKDSIGKKSKPNNRRLQEKMPSRWPNAGGSATERDYGIKLFISRQHTN
jgi:hypothetical protein